MILRKTVPATCHPDKPARCKGLCTACYMRAYRNGGVLPSTPPKVYGNVPTCHPNEPYGAFGLCRKCYLKSYYNKTANPNRKQHRRFAECHPDRRHKARGLCLQCYRKEPDVKTYNDEYSKQNRFRDQLKHKYNITPDDYERMVKEQNGLCAICKNPPRGKTKRLSVDHDHETGKVRGLLCVPCNRALGYLENNNWAESANSYLNNSNLT